MPIDAVEIASTRLRCLPNLLSRRPMQTELAHARDPLLVHIEQIHRRAADSIGDFGQHHAHTQLGGTGCLQRHIRPCERKQHLGASPGPSHFPKPQCSRPPGGGAPHPARRGGCRNRRPLRRSAREARRGRTAPRVVSPRLGEPLERRAIAEPLRCQLRIELRDVDRHGARRRPLIKHGGAASGIGAPLVRDQRARGVTGPRRFIASSVISAVQRKGASPRVVRGSHRDLQAGRPLRRQCQRHRERQFTDRVTADRLPGGQRQFQQ